MDADRCSAFATYMTRDLRLIRFSDLAGNSIRNDAIHHRPHHRGMRLAAYTVSHHVAGLHVVVEVYIEVAYYKHSLQIPIPFTTGTGCGVRSVSSYC